eukprot:719815-Hanusia_phi.AAC.1
MSFIQSLGIEKGWRVIDGKQRVCRTNKVQAARSLLKTLKEWTGSNRKHLLAFDGFVQGEQGKSAACYSNINKLSRANISRRSQAMAGGGAESVLLDARGVRRGHQVRPVIPQCGEGVWGKLDHGGGGPGEKGEIGRVEVSHSWRLMPFYVRIYYRRGDQSAPCCIGSCRRLFDIDEFSLWKSSESVCELAAWTVSLWKARVMDADQ